MLDIYKRWQCGSEIQARSLLAAVAMDSQFLIGKRVKGSNEINEWREK